MIRYVEGDILQSKADAIAHGVAPNDDFHSGLALSIREMWPALYKDFRHYCRLEHPKAGGIWAWRGTNRQTVYSLMTQEAAYGQGAKPGKASVENVRHALAALAEESKKEGLKSVALPRLATGVGGLDWSDVEPLVERYLGPSPTVFYVYKTFKKGVAAAEGA
jgi:O-acetyl-ADP-ribose deacetylase (regulator of RNase III)